MPKFFVCSDIHSFFTPFKKALDSAGFDPENENHWLIVCGDVFDRGDESNQILKYLLKLKRKILIRGNHEDLLEECCAREYPEWHDHSNGTIKTIKDLSNGEKEHFDFAQCCEIAYSKYKPYKNLLKDYFETKNYIFVHGWVPIEQSGKYYYIDTDWQNKDWDKARWICGIDAQRKGLTIPNKTIVCGHWHCSWGYTLKEGTSEFGDNAIWEPYVDEGIIAIDSCVAHTNKINVIVLEDEFI